MSGPLSPVLARGAQPGNGNHGLSSCEYLEDPGGLDFDVLIVSPWAYPGHESTMVPRCGSLRISPGSPLLRGLQPWLSRSTPRPMEMEDAGFLQASRCHLLLKELIHTDKFVSVSLGEKRSSCSLR